MKIILGKEKDYADWLAKNDDPYSRRCFTYAEDWANLLEKRIPENATNDDVTSIIESHADEDSHTADTDGITGFMYGASVSILAQSWVYGDILRRWHNLKTQIGNEGERANREGKTLNPALLNFG